MTVGVVVVVVFMGGVGATDGSTGGVCGGPGILVGVVRFDAMGFDVKRPGVSFCVIAFTTVRVARKGFYTIQHACFCSRL